MTSALPESPLYRADPPRVPPHQLHDHHPVVALRRRVQLVDRLGGGADGGVESERALGAAHVVVDRLGHADDGQPLPPELVRDLQAAVAADRDQRVEAARLECRDEVVRAVDARCSSPCASRLTYRNGLPRLVVPRMVPPRWVIPRTSAGPSGTTPLNERRPSYPRWMP